MAQFGLLYIGEPKFKSQEEGEAHLKQYMAWLNGLGDAVVNRGIPMGAPTRVSADGISSEERADRLAGLTIVEADDLDAAIEIAKACPYIDVAALDVVPIFEMNM